MNAYKKHKPLIYVQKRRKKQVKLLYFWFFSNSSICVLYIFLTSSRSSLSSSASSAFSPYIWRMVLCLCSRSWNPKKQKHFLYLRTVTLRLVLGSAAIAVWSYSNECLCNNNMDFIILICTLSWIFNFGMSFTFSCISSFWFVSRTSSSAITARLLSKLAISSYNRIRLNE